MSRKSPKSSKLGGYRSKFEQNLAKVLKANGIPFKYEPDVLPYYQGVRGGQCRHCHHKDVVKRRAYTPDFKVGLLYLEAKGHLTSAERTKFKAIKENHPSIDFRFVFMKDNKIRKGSSVSYTEWAKTEGFPACVGPNLPKDWIEELRCEASTYTAVKSNPTVGLTNSASSPLQPPTSTKQPSSVSGGLKSKAAMRTMRSSASRNLKPLVVKSSLKKAKACR